MVLEIKDLKVYFKSDGKITKAVDGIDLAIGRDEVMGLVGESGSGKTMTALSIMRLLPEGGRIAGGSILLKGGNILHFTESHMLRMRGRKMSMIFQEPFTSLNPVMRIGEQITEIYSAHGVCGKDEAIRSAKELLSKVQIRDPEKVFYDYPHQLSGGQRQRAMIAMALALKPELLIADEPTTALDVTIQSEILKLLLELKKEFKMSVLFITHDLGVVNGIADRIAVMKNGKIVESGKKDEILKSPKRSYTKMLLGSMPKLEEAATDKKGAEFISLKNLSKAFSVERGLTRAKKSAVAAVDRVSLEIYKGRTLGLVGESASGKTTLGRLILGLLEADSGEILIEGKPIQRALKDAPRQVRKMMQIVFQDPYGSLDPHLQMRDIVLEGPSILGMPKSERDLILKDILHKVNLNYADASKYPHQFSGGERQRIAIARALAVKPQFLVLDEPVSSLDVSIQAGILDLLRRLQKELGLTYLFISHDLRVVGSLADDVAVMHQGTIVEIAPKNTIYRSPRHYYTKKLLSSIPSLKLL